MMVALMVAPRPLYSEMVSDLPAPCGRMEEPREKPKNAVGEINSRIKENRVISENFSKFKPNSASKSTEGSNIVDNMGPGTLEVQCLMSFIYRIV